jgi:hypothetical protein
MDRKRKRDENRNEEPQDAKRSKRSDHNEAKLRQLTIHEMFAKKVSAILLFLKCPLVRNVILILFVQHYKSCRSDVFAGLEIT